MNESDSVQRNQQLEEKIVWARLRFLSKEHEQRFHDSLGVIIDVTLLEDGQIEGHLSKSVTDNTFGGQPSSSSLVVGIDGVPVGGVLSDKKAVNEPSRQHIEGVVSAEQAILQQREYQKMLSSVKVTSPEEKISLPTAHQIENTSEHITPHVQEGAAPKPITEPSNVTASGLTDLTVGTTVPPRRGSSSITTGPEKPESEQGATGTGEMVLNKSDSIEVSERRKHTVFCALHKEELSICHMFKSEEGCSHHYDEEFARGFKQFLSGELSVAAAANNEDSLCHVYVEYIEEHLQKKECPSFCSQLWGFCMVNKVYGLLQYADEHFLVHSVHENRQDKIGTICKSYLGYRNMSVIGTGGFGKVYKYTSGSGPQLAIKEETKHPLITGSAELFQTITKLQHPHVIRMLEYVVGPRDKDGKQCYLFVMPFMNKRSFDEELKKEKTCKCVLDCMKQNENNIDLVFRNYTITFRHVFEGLCYLESMGIVHRDVKASNILVHQNCSCPSPLLCKCPGDGGVVYVLGDLDLLCLEKECTPHCNPTHEEWEKMARHDPAGTMGMKPPESFFRTSEGKLMVSHRSDVWSGCVTMMDILIGKGTHTEMYTELKKFIEVTTEGTKSATQSIGQSFQLVERVLANMQADCELENGSSEVINNVMTTVISELKNLKKLLSDGKSKLHRAQSFRGKLCDVYKEECPLAGILNTAYRAHSLEWLCLSTLPQVYGTPLWEKMLSALKIIAAGVKLMPEKRQHASTVVNALKAIYPKE